MFKKLKRVFDNGRKLKIAFGAVRNDMQNLEEGHFALKYSTNEWIMHLDQNNRELAERVQMLERKLVLLENRSDSERLSVLAEL